MPAWLAAIIAITASMAAAALSGALVALLLICILRLFGVRSRKFMTEDEILEARKALLESLKANDKTIEDYRTHFRTSPCGHWSQAVGTFGGVMDEIWEFNRDHTGKIIETGPFGDSQGETLFEWKEVADFTIACKVIKWSFEDSDEDEADDEEETSEAENTAREPDPWRTIRYDFRLALTDCGTLVGMYEVSEEGSFLNGFWISDAPLTSSDEW